MSHGDRESTFPNEGPHAARRSMGSPLQGMASLRTLGIVCALGVLLAACGPAASPTAPPDTSPTPTELRPVPTPQPTTVPFRPTWTPVPLPTASPSPTRTPPWPTPLPTPTSAPPLYPDRQVGTFFFFWYDCPQGNCDPDQVYALPPGWLEPLPADRDATDGLYYSSLNVDWYRQELRDMRLAGIDIVLPVSWGDSPSAWFRTNVLQGLVEANAELDPPLRIGLFDDTTSEASEYRDFADNQQFDGSTYLGQEPFLDLRDPSCGFFFYDRKIRPFFQTIPQEMWATHNGRPVEEGGRPLIVVYTRERITHLEHAGALWYAIKESFRRDSRDRNGNPITPWIVLDDTWFGEASRSGQPSIDEVADGRYLWGTALLGPRWFTRQHVYTVASAGTGFDNSKAVWALVKREQPRHRTPDGQEGDPGTFLRWSLEQIPPQTNLLLIETWNELWEGTNVCRARYPAIGGQTIPEDYFIDLLRRSIRGQGLWWAAQPLPPSWPLRLAAGQPYHLSLEVENTGTRTWSAEGGEYLELGGDPFPGGLRIPPASSVPPGETGRFAFILEAPDQTTSFTLTWQMNGPEGPFGPPATWTLQVGREVTTPTLRVEAPVAPIRSGQYVTLTVELVPPVSTAEIHLQIRFDPAILRLEAVDSIPEPLRRWKVEVDNARGLGRLEMGGDFAGPLDEVVRLRLQALAPGMGGIWIEQGELWVQDGTALALRPLFVPLKVLAAP